MTQIVKETVTTQTPESTNTIQNVEPTERNATMLQQVEYLIYFLVGTLEALLAIRIVLKLTGASITSGFVNFVYGLTGIFVMPFEGIFRRAFSQGIETTAVLEPSALVAMAVYALLAWGIVAFAKLSSGKVQQA